MSDDGTDPATYAWGVSGDAYHDHTETNSGSSEMLTAPRVAPMPRMPRE